jgi:hypothetical protein
MGRAVGGASFVIGVSFLAAGSARGSDPLFPDIPLLFVIKTIVLFLCPYCILIDSGKTVVGREAGVEEQKPGVEDERPPRWKKIAPMRRGNHA